MFDHESKTITIRRGVKQKVAAATGANRKCVLITHRNSPHLPHTHDERAIATRAAQDPATNDTTPIHTAQCRDGFGCGVRKRLGVSILVLIRTLADMRCIIRRQEVVKWLVDDVGKTQDAPLLEMLNALTKLVMPRDSKEKPADVFGRIREAVSRVRLSAAAGVAAGAKAAGKAGKAKRKKKANAKGKAKMRAPTGGRDNRRQAGPSSGDATQAAEEPTTAEKGVTMFQAYDAL